MVWVVLAVALLAGYGIAWLDRFWAASREQSACFEPLQPADRSTALLADPDGKLAAVYGAVALAALVLALAFFAGYQAGQKALWGFTGAELWLALFLGLTVVVLRARQPALLLAFPVLDLFTMNASHHAAPVDQVNLTPHRALAALPLADRDLFRTAGDDVRPITTACSTTWRISGAPARCGSRTTTIGWPASHYRAHGSCLTSSTSFRGFRSWTRPPSVWPRSPVATTSRCISTG